MKIFLKKYSSSTKFTFMLFVWKKSIFTIFLSCIAITGMAGETLSTDNSEKKICIFIKINPNLEKKLIKKRDEIGKVEKNPLPVANIFHISLRHIKHNLTDNQLKELIQELKKVVEKNAVFNYFTEQLMFLDEDLDVGLNYIMPATFYQLQKDVLDMAIPGESKSYNPHTTIYYQVNKENRKAVQDYLNTHLFNSTLPYTATSVGLGILGPHNNVIKSIVLFPLFSNENLDKKPV